MGRQYDPKTGTWKSTGGGTKTDSKKSSSSKKKSTSGKKSSKKTTKKGSKKSSKSKSKSKGSKKSSSSFNYFTARLRVRPTASTMKIKPSDTIAISGVGSYLGGKFYVQDVTYTLDSNGLSLDITLIKVGFSRDSVKPKHSTGSSSSSKSTGTKIHKVKKGETLLSICKKYYKKKSKKVQNSHLKKMKKKNNIKNEKAKLKVGRKIYIV